MQRVDVPRLRIAIATAILLVSLTSGSVVAQEEAGIIGVVTDESAPCFPVSPSRSEARPFKCLR